MAIKTKLPTMVVEEPEIVILAVTGLVVLLVINSNFLLGYLWISHTRSWLCNYLPSPISKSGTHESSSGSVGGCVRK